MSHSSCSVTEFLTISGFVCFVGNVKEIKSLALTESLSLVCPQEREMQNSGPSLIHHDIL